MLGEIMGEGGSRFIVAIVGVSLALLCLFGILWIMRGRSGPSPFIRGGRNRQPRLQVLDAAAVDRQRRLVLIRRDNVEHLIMIGGPTDIVVESGITTVARTTAGETAPAEPEAPLPVREEPLPERAPAARPIAAPAALPIQAAAPGPVPAPAPVPAPRPATPPRAEPAATAAIREQRVAPAQVPAFAPPLPAGPSAKIPGAGLRADPALSIPSAGAPATAAPALSSANPSAAGLPAGQTATPAQPAAPAAPVVQSPDRRMAPEPAVSPAGIDDAARLLDTARDRVFAERPATERPQPAAAVPVRPAPPSGDQGRALGSDFERILEEEMANNLAAREAQPANRAIAANQASAAPDAPAKRSEPTLQTEVARIFGEMSASRDK